MFIVNGINLFTEHAETTDEVADCSAVSIQGDDKRKVAGSNVKLLPC
jgi:hypothetical protein